MMSDKTSDKTRGSIEMSAAMAVSGTIGWFVLTSGQAAEVVVFWRCLFGAATLLAICVAMGLFRHLNRRVLVLAALGVVHTGLVYILLYGAIQKLPTSLSGALSFIYPAVAILVDVVALGHRLQAGQIVGMAMVLVAAAGAILGWAPIRQRFSRRA